MSKKTLQNYGEKCDINVYEATVILYVVLVDLQTNCQNVFMYVCKNVCTFPCIDLYIYIHTHTYIYICVCFFSMIMYSHCYLNYLCLFLFKPSNIKLVTGPQTATCVILIFGISLSFLRFYTN